MPNPQQTPDRFHRLPWQVNWFIPELEHRKYAKAFREDEDYSERVNLYFGDVHKHTSLSPCARVHPYNQSCAESYAHARDVAGCDFLAICDHAEHLSQEQWQDCMRLARETNEPGRFIAWPAVEWATAFAMHQTRRQLYLAATYVAENPFHAECLKLLRKLRESGGQMARRQLMRVMRCKALDFDQIISTLVQQGDIVPVEIPTKTRPAQGYQIA